ncbi:LRC55 protein, partial [Pterocles burchelli]|nr:LRC55 protein [Pterocles burchelli]
RRAGVGRRPAMLLGPWLVAVAAVAAGGVAGCPAPCSCRGLAVDCSGRQLLSVPPELPLDTGNLSLAHNRIASLPPGYLGCLAQLRALDLRNNSLSALPAGLFRGAARLAQLDLSYNNLSLLPADAFGDAAALLRLDLSHNPGLRRLAECRAPPEVAGAPLLSLTEESFQACHLTLTLDDYLFIAFVGFVVSIASVATNFLLGITANCCHRWSKASEDEDV